MEIVVLILLFISIVIIWQGSKNGRGIQNHKEIIKQKPKTVNPRPERIDRQFNEEKYSGTYIFRKGKMIKADSVFFARTSGNLDKMIKALNTPTNLIDRHFLLLNIVISTYKYRNQPEMANLCKKVAEMHIKEFPEIWEDMKEDFKDFLPRVPTFENYALLLTEEGKYKEAIEVCKKAVDFGLRDGTKSGYKGRIERIKKKWEKGDCKMNSVQQY